jgi:hypothetical protein
MQLSQLENEFLTSETVLEISLCSNILGSRLASMAILIRGILALSTCVFAVTKISADAGEYYYCCRKRRVDVIEACRCASYGNHQT